MKVKSVKSKKKSKKTKKVTKKAKSGKKKKVENNKHAGGKFKDFMRLEQETFGLTTERCGCTPEKGCLDPEIEPIEFKAHQVHNGLDNESELTLKSNEIHNSALDLFSTHEHSESLSKDSKKTWVDSFFAIFGLKPKKKP